MKPRGSYGPETTYADRHVRQTEWVTRGAEPYLMDWVALNRLFDHCEWPEVGDTFWWLGETWRVVCPAPQDLGVLVRRDGPRTCWELRSAGWWARLPRWVRWCLAPLLVRLQGLGIDLEGDAGTYMRLCPWGMAQVRRILKDW